MNKIRTFKNKYGKTLGISEENTYIYYEKQKIPMEYIDTYYLGTPNVLSMVADCEVAGRDKTKWIKYRVEGRDLNIVFVHDGSKYAFSHIGFSNFTFS